MNFTLNGTPLSAFGIIPGEQPGSNVAMSGFWDMPPRIGKTYQEWADEPGIEPFLRPDEIQHGGIDIRFVGLVEASSLHDVVQRIYDFFTAIDAYDSLVTFASDFGTAEVYVSGQIASTILTDQIAEISMTFRQPACDLDGTLPGSANSSEGIDGYSFDQLGIMLLTHDPQYFRAAVKPGHTTVYGQEGYQITKPGINQYSHRFLVCEHDYNAFATVLQNLKHLLSLPGKRVLRMGDGRWRDVFCKDGFRVTEVYVDPGQVMGILDIPFTEISSSRNEDVKVFETAGKQFTNKHGQLLGFNL